MGSQAPTLVGADELALPADRLIGQEVIGQYVIRRKIGAGGMGAVYLAEQSAMGRNAVIKVLHPWMSQDPEVATRFENEARAVAKLSDPHIVQIFNYGAMADGTLFLAMEYLDGRTLSQVIAAEGSLNVERAVEVALQICRALSESHRHGVVHRDLKPSNVMLLPKAGGDFVKVLDFGVAKLQGSKHTASGQAVGTPRYMSPEQLAGSEVDGRSDLYALGLMLHEMLAGEPPFAADTPVAYVHKHMSEAPPPLQATARGAAVPTALRDLLLQTLAKAPEDRPKDADALADALRAALRAPTQAATALTTTGSTHASADEEDREGPGRVVAVVMGLALLGAAGAGGYVWWSRSGVDEGIGSVSDTDSPDTVRAEEGAPTSTGEVPTVEPASTADLPSAPERPAFPTSDGGTGASGPTTPMPPLSPETEALLERSVLDLEREFFAVLDTSYVPPSAKTQIKDAYGTMARTVASGEQGELQRKAYLVQVIVGYRNTPKIPPGFDLPIAKLENILRTLDAAAPPDIRMQTYEEMVDGFSETYRSKEDMEYWRRYALVSLIGTFSGDEGYLERFLE